MNSQITPYKYVYIIGCGDVGERVALRWQGEGIVSTGLVATEASLEHLKSRGIKGLRLNLDSPKLVAPKFSPDSLVYYFVPPPAEGTQDSRCQHFLALFPGQASEQANLPKCIVAISTTGVYGDCGGEKIDEEQVPKPVADRALRRLDMENQLRQWCRQHAVRLVILRVGGIYGPQRLPLKRIQKGIPVLHEALAPNTNRIHEEDLADICVAAAKTDTPFRIYNVSDGRDSNMTEYFYTLADHFKLPRPPAVDWQEAECVMSAGMLSYLRESRRIDNSRMLRELGIQLRYPNLEKGLSEISPDIIDSDD